MLRLGPETEDTIYETSHFLRPAIIETSASKRSECEMGMKSVHLGVNDGSRAIELYHRKGFKNRKLYLLTKLIERR